VVLLDKKGDQNDSNIPVDSEKNDYESVVSMRGVTCRFDKIVANDNVNFELARGEIHALLGENGAGKTTLMSILYGLYQPERGEIYVKGKQVAIKSPLNAIELGIAMVHQHFLLTLPHSVTENIIVGLKSDNKKRRILLDTDTAEKKIAELSKKYGLNVNPMVTVGSMSVGEQQRVEIIKALYRDIDILILDEPTSMLTPQEEKALFETLKSMVEQGLSIIFITHKLHEVMSASTRVTVLQNGRVVGTVRTSKTNEADLAKMMVGRPVIHQVNKVGGEKNAAEKKQIILELSQVSALNNSKIPVIKDLSLDLRKGEILAIAGVDGNGQSELAEVISGLRSVESGQIFMDGQVISNHTPKKIREMGLAYIPEDRLNTGLILDYTIAENLILDRWYQKPYSGKIFLKKSDMKKFALKAISDFDIRTPGIDVPVKSMSGGNLQKVVLARELSRSPKVLIAHNPTRGLDIGATEYVHTQLINQRNSGVGVLLFSLDLDEILLISDRIAVIYEGRIMAVIGREYANVDHLGMLMGGNSGKNTSLHKVVKEGREENKI
jgi:general nucleoside transport system ATP-binding protein